MTHNQQFLLDAAKDVIAYMDRREKGLYRGMYDDLRVGRQLQAAVEAVEAEAAKDVADRAAADTYAAQTHAS